MFKFKKIITAVLLVLVVSFATPANVYAQGSGYHNCLSKSEGTAEDLFTKLRCKAATTVDDLRSIVYILGGLGIIVFAFGAIFGKINFGQLSNIGIGLFLVAVMGPFIMYFADSDKNIGKLGFGTYLPTDYSAVVGSPDGGSYLPGCMKDANGKCDSSGLDNKVEGGADQDGLSGNDLKDQVDGETEGGDGGDGDLDGLGDFDLPNPDLDGLGDAIMKNPGGNLA